MYRLLGIHIAPPERAVVPPTSAVFSRITTDFPASRITRAAHMEPPPQPTTTKSNISSKFIRVDHSFELRTTGHRQYLACDVRGSITGEKQHSLRHFFWPARTAQWKVHACSLRIEVGFGPVRLRPLGCDHSGRDAIDANAERSPLGRRHARKL